MPHSFDRALPGTVWPRLVVPAFGLTCLALFAVLYEFRTDWYFRILTLFIKPFRFPFLDAQVIMAVVECWDRGIDVYAQDPCDVLGRVHNYSPLWLRAGFVPTDKAWTNWLGLTLDSLFLLSLALLPRPRRLRDLVLVVLATFSSLTLFAMERANMDVVMFLLAIIAGCVLEHSLPRRVLGYGAIVLAGLLKFYPFVLLLLLLRERFARFVALALAAAAIMAWFVWQYHDELVRMAANLPTVEYLADGFGSAQLPGGLATVLGGLPRALGWHDDRAVALLQNPDLVAGERLLLIVVAILLAGRIATATAFRAALAELTGREMNFLVIGAALVCGCFFAGESIGYRGIHLLLAVSGVTVLARSSPGGIGALFRWCGYALIFVMWYLAIQNVVGMIVGSPPDGRWGAVAGNAGWVAHDPAWLLAAISFMLVWIIHELAWWLLVTSLLAVLFNFVLQSTVGRLVLGMVLPRQPPRRATPLASEIVSGSG